MPTFNWAEFLRKVPLDLHDQLVLAAVNGLEFAVQRLLRVDDAFILARGRVGGTSDVSRIFFLPYDRLAFVAFSRPLEDEVLAPIFGELIAPLKEVKALEMAAEAEASVEAPPPVAEKMGVNTAAMLERLRARAATQAADTGKIR